MVPFRYNVRSLLVRKLTTAATVVGIGLVVFVFAAALMLEQGVMNALAVGGRADNVIVLRKGSDAELSSGIANENVKLLRAHPQVAAAGVVGEVVVVITADRVDGSGVSNVLIRGTTAEGYAFRPELTVVTGRLPKPGTNEVIVGKKISGRFKGVGMGESFNLKRNQPFTIVGEFTAAGTSFESEVWGDVDNIRTATGRGASVSSARVRLTSPDAFEAYRALVESDKNLSVRAMREADYYAKASEQTSGFLKGVGFAIAFLFSIAAMLGAAITMNAAVANRTREIGTLRALGFSRRGILVSFLLEALFLAAVGGAVGSLAVLLLSLMSFPVMNFATFSEIVISFSPAPSVFVKALVFSGVMGLIGGLVPAIRASQVSPIEAMRG
jgi:putative ABC transport system permease protein